MRDSWPPTLSNSAHEATSAHTLLPHLHGPASICLPPSHCRYGLAYNYTLASIARVLSNRRGRIDRPHGLGFADWRLWWGIGREGERKGIWEIWGESCTGTLGCFSVGMWGTRRCGHRRVFPCSALFHCILLVNQTRGRPSGLGTQKNERESLLDEVHVQVFLNEV
jgi:hypothetical protein